MEMFVTGIQKETLTERIRNEEQLLDVLQHVDMYNVCAGLPAKDGLDYNKLYYEWPHAQSLDISIENGHFLSDDCSIFLKYKGLGRRWTSCSSCCYYGQCFVNHIPKHRSLSNLMEHKVVVYNNPVDYYIPTTVNSLFYFVAEIVTKSYQHEALLQATTQAEL